MGLYIWKMATRDDGEALPDDGSGPKQKQSLGPYLVPFPLRPLEVVRFRWSGYANNSSDLGVGGSWYSVSFLEIFFEIPLKGTYIALF